MSSALVAILMLSAQPSGGCCTAVDETPGQHRLCEKLYCHANYYKRLYYGHFDRHPFDYRFQFDYPWWAGPSQPHWPIPPLPQGEAGPWQDAEWEAKHRSGGSQTGLAQPTSPDRPSSAGRITLKPHGVPAKRL